MEEPSFAQDLRAGLTRSGQKELPSKYLYDEVGSALFEVICVLPEYGLTRADARLLKQHAAGWVERLAAPVTVAELGSGTSKKTRLILEPLLKRQKTVYFPIDISAAALAQCARELGELGEPGAMEVVGLNMEYLAGLREVAARRPAGNHLLILFLGSTIGNFDRQQGESFLVGIRQVLMPGDQLFLSTDLVKPEAALLSAYDDTAGVTAAFNKNVLCRINRELGANFAVADFEHVAHWNTTHRRIEMHLRARTAMEVEIPKASLRVQFQPGETIKTEDSYKYELAEIIAMAQRSGFACQEQWIDPQWPFAQSLLRAV